MPRTLSPDAITEKDKDYNWPIELYQIKLDEETLYYAMFPENIAFFDEFGNQQTYYAAAISRSKIKKNNKTAPDSVTVTFGNVNKNFSAYIANTQFEGKKVTIWKVFRNHVDKFENKIEMFTDSVIDSISTDEYNLTAELVSNLDALEVELPRRSYGINCRWPGGFGGEGCGYNIPTSSGTVDSISNNRIYDSEMNQPADRWKHGIITIANESRKIIYSASGFVDAEYPFQNAQTGDEYHLEAGCDLTYNGGHGCKYWNNTQFYGGFLDIPKIRNVRRVD